MKAYVTYERLASEEVQETAKALNRFVEENEYMYHINWYCVEDVSNEADKFVKEAISKLDNSMKGWKAVADGTETHYQIRHTKDGILYSYTRHYTK